VSFISCSLNGLMTEYLLSYRKKNLRKRTVEFIEALHRTMGVHSVVLQGYEASDRMVALL
jgi:hypothetical protein